MNKQFREILSKNNNLQPTVNKQFGGKSTKFWEKKLFYKQDLSIFNPRIKVKETALLWKLFKCSRKEAGGGKTKIYWLDLAAILKCNSCRFMASRFFCSIALFLWIFFIKKNGKKIKITAHFECNICLWPPDFSAVLLFFFEKFWNKKGG